MKQYNHILKKGGLLSMSMTKSDIEITYVGTGVSTAIPIMGHFGDCACRDAIQTPNSKNRRNNVSLLLTWKTPLKEEAPQPVVDVKGSEQPPSCFSAGPILSSDGWKNILIDCGKTFRQAYFESLAMRGLKTIDSLLLTHDHADAVQGLDDLRDLQSWELRGKYYTCRHYVPTFLTQTTLSTLEQQVGYIIRNSRVLGDAVEDANGFQQKVVDSLGGATIDSQHERIIERRSTALDLWVLSSTSPQRFYCPGLPNNYHMYSVPVEHGPGYISLGFVFGPASVFNSNAARTDAANKNDDDGDGLTVVYLSDVSSIPQNSMAFLRSLPRIDLLVADLLLGPGETHFSHYCWDDVWNLARELDPVCVHGTGMFCSLEHEQTNRKLAEQLDREHQEGRCSGVKRFELAFDGLSVTIGKA